MACQINLEIVDNQVVVLSHAPHHLQYAPLWAIWKSLLAMLQPCGYKNMEKADDGG